MISQDSSIPWKILMNFGDIVGICGGKGTDKNIWDTLW
jgi:hypothetical protein